MTKHIPLTQGKSALVDDDDFDRISQYKWFYSGRGYAARMVPNGHGKQTAMYMHREIMNTPAGMDTDHINGDGLDNRKINLRICTHAQNCANNRWDRLPVPPGWKFGPGWLEKMS